MIEQLAITTYELKLRWIIIIYQEAFEKLMRNNNLYECN